MNFSVQEIQKISNARLISQPVTDELTITKVITDSRENLKAEVFLAFVGERFDAHDFLDEVLEQSPAVLIVSKELSATLIAKANACSCRILLVKDTLIAYQEIAQANLKAHPECKVIAITGSTGKTSVKSIIAQSLEDYFPEQILSTLGNTNNHIGLPQNLLRLNSKHKIAVLEMGTSSPNEISRLVEIATPDIAILTGIGHSHIGNFPHFSELIKEKTDIFRSSNPSCINIIHESVVEQIKTQADLSHLTTHVYGESSHCDSQITYESSTLNSSNFTITSNQEKYQIEDCSLSGRHQAINVGAAVACLEALNLSLEPLKQSLKKLELPAGRMKIEAIKDFTFINDAYNANPQSMAAALDWFAELKHEGRKVIIVGDMLELGEHSQELHINITKQLSQKHFQDIIFFAVGPQSSQALKTIADDCYTNSDKAAQNITKRLQKNDLILLKASRGIALEKIILALQD